MRSTLYCVLCVLLTVALAACSLRYVRDFWMLSFLYSLQLHATLACLAGAVLALYLRRHFYGLILLVWAAGLAGHALAMLQEFSRPPSPAALSTPHLRLLSFNILSSNVENGADIADYLIESGADVAVVPEARPLHPQLAKLAPVFPYQVGCEARADSCDLLLLSRYPIEDVMRASLSDLRGERFILARIGFPGASVSVAATHLTKPYFDDYHNLELWNLSNIVEATPGPLIVAGDFNSDILAPDMQRFLRANGLFSARSEPRTWPVWGGAYGIAIDHVFARAPVQLVETRRIASAFGSNHYGLVADFVVSDPSSSSASSP